MLYDLIHNENRTKCKQSYLVMIRTLFLTSLQSALSVYFQVKNDFHKYECYKVSIRFFMCSNSQTYFQTLIHLTLVRVRMTLNSNGHFL